MVIITSLLFIIIILLLLLHNHYLTFLFLLLYCINMSISMVIIVFGIDISSFYSVNTTATAESKCWFLRLLTREISYSMI